MGQVLHGSATTTEAIRRAIQHSQASLRTLAKRHGINQKTVAMWKRRTSTADLPTGPKVARSTVLSIEEEAVIVAIGYLITTRRYRTAALIAASTITGSLVGQILKFVLARARPTLVPHFVEIKTLSYPSGHAVNSAVVFLTLGTLLARAEPVRRTRIYIVTVAILFTVLIGCSRVYVGVHWPTDVIAGWAIGGSWALLWWRSRLVRNASDSGSADPVGAIYALSRSSRRR